MEGANNAQEALLELSIEVNSNDIPSLKLRKKNKLKLKGKQCFQL